MGTPEAVYPQPLGPLKEHSTFAHQAPWETEQSGVAGGGGLLWSHTAGTNGFLPAALFPHGSLQQSMCRCYLCSELPLKAEQTLQG